MPHLDFYDFLTFASIAAVLLGGLGAMVLIFSLPGKIALKRKHPDAEAVNLMGWAGLGTVYPWIQALIWSFKPTDVIDIRRGPREEQRAIEEENARLRGIRIEEKEEGVGAVAKRELESPPGSSDA
jgi:hypothetical protein